MKKLYLALLCMTLSAGCSSDRGFENNYSASHQASLDANSPSSQVENPAFWGQSPEIVWAQLQQTPAHKLADAELSNNSTISGWAKLTLLSRQYSTNTPELAQRLMAWRNQYPNHPGNRLIPDNSTLESLLKTTPPQHIALLLPLQGKFGAPGQVVKDGFLNAYYENLSKQQNVAFYDTQSNPNIAALYQEAVSKGADVVIGPLTKDQVTQLMHSTSFSVPTIALNYTDTGWMSSLPSNLYQFGLSPLDEAKQLADKATAAGLTRAIIIAPKSEWGTTAVKALSDRWQAQGGKISDVLYFSDKSNLSQDIAGLMHINQKEDIDKSRDKEDKATLAEQRRQDFDVVFLLAPPKNARIIVPLLRFYYLGKTPVYATSSVYSGSPQPQRDMDLNGVIFCDIPWVFHNGSGNRLFAVGRDAYQISQNLPRFTALPNFPMYGATGELTLTPQRQFYRQLTWVQMHHGQP